MNDMSAAVLLCELDGVITDLPDRVSRLLEPENAAGVAMREWVTNTLFQNPGWHEVLRPIPGAVEALAAWRAAGGTVVIATSRRAGLSAPTRDWLARHEIPYDQWAMVGEKAEIAGLVGATHAVEDSWMWAAALAKVVPSVFFIQKAHTQGFVPEGAHPVPSLARAIRVAMGDKRAKLPDGAWTALSVIGNHVYHQGRAPTLEEIMEATGFAKTTLRYYLERLVRAGLLFPSKGQHRALRPTAWGWEYLEMPNADSGD